MNSQRQEHALVLGGSSGIGLACARRLVADGFSVFVVFREPKQAALLSCERLSELGPAVSFINADATQDSGISETVQAMQRAFPHSRVSVLLHSIAWGSTRALGWEREHTPGGGGSLTAHDIQLTLNAMGVSLYRWVKELGERDLLADDTRVLALTSEGARRAWPGYAAISMAKAALEASIRGMAVELGKNGVRANAIQAGITPTASLERVPDALRLKELALGRNPLGRLTSPEDIAGVVSLLCRPEARWINGAVIPVDGGEQWA